MATPGFWDEPDRARETIDEANRLKAWVGPWEELDQKIQDLSEIAELLEAEPDEDLEDEWSRELRGAERGLEALELKTMLQGEEDLKSAIVTVHPGAGGTESQDWAEMLTRMYTRWAERQGYGVQVLDLQPGKRPESRAPRSRSLATTHTGISRPRRVSPIA